MPGQSQIWIFPILYLIGYLFRVVSPTPISRFKSNSLLNKDDLPDEIFPNTVTIITLGFGVIFLYY